MVTQNAINVATGATSTVLQGAGVGAAPTFTATPTVTSINFGGTSLSNYTEGTWTPTIDGAVSGSTTYVAQTGYYTRVGNLVTVQCFLQISAATGTGNATVGALPFTVKNQTQGNPIGSIIIDASGWTWPAGRTQLGFSPILNTTTSLIQSMGSALAISALQMTNAAATFYITGSYEI